MLGAAEGRHPVTSLSKTAGLFDDVIKQDRQSPYNVTSRLVHETTFAAEK
jgi:hypothetical protein